jgi:hypothetical protein
VKPQWIAIVAVIVIVVAVAAGFGGYSVGVGAGRSQALAARNAFFQGRGGNGGGQAQGQGASGAANADNFASGQVKSVSGDTIELSTAQNVLTVKVSADTQIQKQATGTVSDLQVGERITVQGQKQADGSFAASSIQIGRARPPQAGGTPQPTAGQ